MRNSRASLFLMELMISILFFSLSSAVCIQLFAKAHTINKTTENKSNATLIAQDISEYFHYSKGNQEQILSYFTEYEVSEEGVLIYFTRSGNPCSKDSAYYTAFLTFEQEVSYRTLTFHITCTGEEETLYSSTLKKYIQATL